MPLESEEDLDILDEYTDMPNPHSLIDENDSSALTGEQLDNDQPFICYPSQLYKLLKMNLPVKCPKCNAPICIEGSSVGTAMNLKWVNYLRPNLTTFYLERDIN